MRVCSPPMTSPPAMPHPCLSRPSHLTCPTITHPLKCQWQLRAILHPSMAQQQLLRWRHGGGGGAARPPAASPAVMLAPCLSRPSHLPCHTITHPSECQSSGGARLHPNMPQLQLLQRAAWQRRRHCGTPCHQPCCHAQATSHLHVTHQLSIPGCHIHHYRATDQMAPAQQLTPGLGSSRAALSGKKARKGQMGMNQRHMSAV